MTIAPDSTSQRRWSPHIRLRARATRRFGVLASLMLALILPVVVFAEAWLFSDRAIEAEMPANYTIRAPLFLGSGAKGHFAHEDGVLVARGAAVDQTTAELAEQARQAIPSQWQGWGAFAAGFFILFLLFTTQLRRSHGGRLLRNQVVVLGLILACAVVTKAALLMSSMVVLVAPIALLAIMTTVAIDATVGLAMGVVVSVVVGALVPFDPGTVALLIAQGGTAAIYLSHRRGSKIAWIIAALLGGLASFLAYPVLFFLAWEKLPLLELEHPLSSPWIACAVGGIVSACLAGPGIVLMQRLLGDITENRLVALEDLSNPLLKQIAEKSPGTWQHSLAMANMAEIAANAVGASGRLVRVGAYYHDLGKSLTPTYFIENLESGQTSPHDALTPEQSADMIFRHVTEGVKNAREAGLPERIIDFMHMHHGDGVLEYFWAKCQESGNPKVFSIDAFRYPGLRPDTKETAILAICDAVEAASRTLKDPNEKSIRQLVERIVYGKLHLGQLDDSGLTAFDLRRISNVLMDFIKHGRHHRIEYPWQKNPDSADAAPLPASSKSTPSPDDLSQLGKVPRLDSLDRPAQPITHRPSAPVVTTSQSTGAHHSLKRPPTAVEVAQATSDKTASFSTDSRNAKKTN